MTTPHTYDTDKNAKFLLHLCHEFSALFQLFERNSSDIPSFRHIFHLIVVIIYTKLAQKSK